MVPIYDYYGLIVSFEKTPILPITIYGYRNDRKSAIQIQFKDGLLEKLSEIPQSNELDSDDRKIFKLIVEKNSSEIIKQWLNYFLYKKTVQIEVIKSKIDT